MDQVTRKRMHKGLCERFDRAVDFIEASEVMPAMAMLHPIGIIHINGEPYEVRIVLARPDDDEGEPETAA